MRRRKMLDYPSTLSLEAVQSVIEIVKTRSMGERKEELAFAAWNVSGFLLKTFIGRPTLEVGCDRPDCDCTDEEKELLVELGKAIDGTLDEGTFTGDDEDAGFDFSILLTILPLILELLEALGLYTREIPDDEV
jgi:hypothetical protein